MKSLVKQFVFGIWRKCVPRRARNSLRLWLMLEMPDRAPQLIEEFSGPVVVLAPHMDDEIIGPGGAVIRHVQSGAAVTFIFMTDGNAGDPQGGPPLSETRKSESRSAAQIVGVNDLIFLDGPDGALDATPEIVAALQRILVEKKPAVIYLPALTDHHHDHWATNRILRKVLDRLPDPLARNLVIRGYEVWTALPANRMADITAVAETKKKAIAVFQSQTRFVDYSRAIIGLNQYRSMMRLEGRGYAEGFLQMTNQEYRKFFDRISLNVRFGEGDPAD